jgi:hypothetical protein
LFYKDGRETLERLQKFACDGYDYDFHIDQTGRDRVPWLSKHRRLEEATLALAAVALALLTGHRTTLDKK